MPNILVRGGGAIGAIGLSIALIFPHPYVALVGFALVGIGLATIVPLAFSAAGNVPDVPPGVGIAGVATIGYAGFLAGPPIIGFIANYFTLRYSLIFVVILMLTLVFTGKALKQAKPSA